MSLPRYTAQELKDMPTLSVGEADDLKVEGDDENGPYRVWLSRVGPEDGAPYSDQVTVERLQLKGTGKWYDAEVYPG